VGKTTLLTKWAAESGFPFVYWVASRNTPMVLRQGLAEALERLESPHAEGPLFPTWRALFQQIARTIGDRRIILILDEFPYAMEADPALPSELQNAWDHIFKDTNLFLVLAGSHIGMMDRLQRYQAPLYGCFTARLAVEPMPFLATTGFFPRYTAAERVAVYAITGGVPGYVELFDDQLNITENLRQRIVTSANVIAGRPTLASSNGAWLSKRSACKTPFWPSRRFASALMRDHLIDFIGTHTFEELCRDWVAVQADLGALPFLPERIGSFCRGRLRLMW